MPLERPTAVPGERQPCARPLADEPLVDLDVAGLLERAHLLGQHRIADLDVVPDEAELSLGRRRQQGHDREANRMAQQVVQLVAWVAQRRPNSQVATSSGMIATATLPPKWMPGALGPHQPVATLNQMTTPFQTRNARTDPTNQSTALRLQAFTRQPRYTAPTRATKNVTISAVPISLLPCRGLKLSRTPVTTYIAAMSRRVHRSCLSDRRTVSARPSASSSNARASCGVGDVSVMAHTIAPTFHFGK